MLLTTNNENVHTVKVSSLARDRERTVHMFFPDIYQNDRDEKLNQKKFTLTITLTVTRQERNFHCKSNSQKHIKKSY